MEERKEGKIGWKGRKVEGRKVPKEGNKGRKEGRKEGAKEGRGGRRGEGGNKGRTEEEGRKEGSSQKCQCSKNEFQREISVQ